MDLDGSMVSLSDRLEDGKPIVLNFWATWCGPCTSELPAFNKAAADYADEITFMMINLTDGQVETVPGVREFLTENGYSLPVYFDKKGSASGPYGASSIPLTYFITSDGMVVGGHMGSMSEETLYNYLDQLLELEQ
jgi:thiol-disulfide isomerase/thioredoxin